MKNLALTKAYEHTYKLKSKAENLENVIQAIARFIESKDNTPHKRDAVDIFQFIQSLTPDNSYIHGVRLHEKQLNDARHTFFILLRILNNDCNSTNLTVIFDRYFNPVRGYGETIQTGLMHICYVLRDAKESDSTHEVQSRVERIEDEIHHRLQHICIKQETPQQIFSIKCNGILTKLSN